MNDRLTFDSRVLPNGATIYRRPSDTLFTTVYVVIPIGSAHSGVAAIPPGAVHFLEHIQCDQSRLNPTSGDFDFAVGMTGGWSNAHTYPTSTTYELSVPNRHLEALLPRLCSTVFEPSFTEEAFNRQRGIIANERQLERWWPGETELSQYMTREWQADEPVGQEQLFGSDADLAALSPEILQIVHRHYFDSRLAVIVVGSGDIAPLIEYVNNLSLTVQPLTPKLTPPRWLNRQYHEKTFQQVSCHELNFGGIVSGEPDPRITAGLTFILEYLTNSTHGALWTWLRTEKGWVYGIDWGASTRPWAFDWTMTISLSQGDQVATVRQEIWERVRQALGDTASLNREVDRVRDADEAFSYETSDSVIEFAESQLRNYGRIYTEAQWSEFVEPFRDSAYALDLFQRYFNEGEIGSFCAVPEAA